MQIRKNAVVRIAIFIFLLAALPAVGSAATLTVSKLCTIATTTCFSTISGAISAANPTTTGDIIKILPSNEVYSEATLSMKNGLTITGIETSRTILQSSSGGAVISATNVTNSFVSNVTINFANGTGIQLTDSSVLIHNNIFRGTGGGTAISILNTALAQDIDHNTFYSYSTAISSNIDVNITNNIFNGNGSSSVFAVLAPLAKFVFANNNVFFNNAVPARGFLFNDQDAGAFIANHSNIPNNTVTSTDPLFVHPTDSDQIKLDYHVQQGSPTLGNGTNNSDIGAFGGPGADSIPFPVEVISLVSPTPNTTATITWSENLASNVTNTASPGSYDVTYRLNSGPTTTVNIPAPASTTDITGLTATPPTPGAPILAPPSFSNQTLILTWMPGSSATSYIIHIRDTVTSIQSDIPVGNVNTFTITGLVNGRNYDIWITPYAQAAYNFAVFVKDNSGGPFNPGVAHESVSSPVSSLQVGTPQSGPDSNTVTASPEKIQAVPNLPNSGCFIATAAYGYYSAPQVQLLRDFRDRYLMTNQAGRAFVEWYYRYGPIGAEFINAHAWIKPAVRIALLPLIGAALFMIKTSAGIKLAVLVGFGLISAILINRKPFADRGGAR